MCEKSSYILNRWQKYQRDTLKTFEGVWLSSCVDKCTWHIKVNVSMEYIMKVWKVDKLVIIRIIIYYFKKTDEGKICVSLLHQTTSKLYFLRLTFVDLSSRSNNFTSLINTDTYFTIVLSFFPDIQLWSGHLKCWAPGLWPNGHKFNPSLNWADSTCKTFFERMVVLHYKIHPIHIAHQDYSFWCWFLFYDSKTAGATVHQIIGTWS